MRAPGYAGPRLLSSADALAVSPPSERSMWVDPEFHGRDFTRRQDLCFVLMEYSAELTSFYESAVKPVVEEFGMVCERADDINKGHRDILEEIWEAINETRFLIADLTGRNANVYYELGIASTLGKGVIAIHKEVKDGPPARLPFDVQGRRTIFYEDTAKGAEVFKAKLRTAIGNMLATRP